MFEVIWMKTDDEIGTENNIDRSIVTLIAWPKLLCPN